MTTTIFDFMAVRTYGMPALTDTVIVEGNDQTQVTRPDGGPYGTYRATFEINSNGPGIVTGTVRTTAEFAAFLRTIQGAHGQFLWREPFIEFMRKVENDDTDGMLGDGTGSQTDFGLAHRFINEPTLRVWEGGVEKFSPAAWTLEGNYGDAPLIRFALSPSFGVAITVAYEFFYPVKFNPEPSLGAWRGTTDEFRTQVGIKEIYSSAHRVQGV